MDIKDVVRLGGAGPYVQEAQRLLDLAEASGLTVEEVAHRKYGPLQGEDATDANDFDPDLAVE